MRRLLRYSGRTLVLLFFPTAFAHAQQARDYPGFVAIDDTPTSVSITAPVPQLLTSDDLTTTTWLAVRARIPNVFRLLNEERNPARFSLLANELAADLVRLEILAVSQAPDSAAIVEQETTRARSQLTVAIGAVLDRRAAPTATLELLGETLTLLERDIARAELPESTAPNSALNWTSPPGLTNDRFARDIAEWNGARLQREMRVRAALLQRVLAGPRDQWPEKSEVIELAELARALADRPEEVPYASRVTFRQAALRIEVVAQNLSDFVKDRNRAQARRQVRVLRECLHDTQLFLELRARGL